MTAVTDLIKRHSPNVALQFSGGRDSLAMLLALRDYLPLLTVYHLDTGDAFPETRALVEVVRNLVPHLVVVEGDVHRVHRELGLPSDVLHPGAASSLGKALIDGYVPLIDRHTCCLHTMVAPMHARMKADGITLVLRGQRSSDTTRSPTPNGGVVDGVQIAYPIEHWTTEQVEQFIRDCGVPLPPYYAEGLTSAPDCMHCTAWLEHGAHKYLTKYHPQVAAEVNQRLNKIRVVVEPHVRRLFSATEAFDGI